MALRTPSGLQAPDSRDGIFPHADTTDLCREAEMLKIRAAALSTLLVMRLDWLSSYGCGDCTGLLGATLGSTSAERPQYRSAGHDEQGAAAVVAAEVLHTDSAWMTATGSPSNEGRDRTAGLGSFVGEPLRTRPPGFSLHRFHPLRITNWANTDGADMKPYEFVHIYSSEAISTIASSKAHSLLPDRRPYEPLSTGRNQTQYHTARDRSWAGAPDPGFWSCAVALDHGF